MVTYTNGRRHRLRRSCRCDYDEGVRVMAIHTGLSVTVAGYLVELDRDDCLHRAVVVVKMIDGHVPTGLEVEAVKVAADMLAARARRFLGVGWVVVPWQPPRSVVSASA